MMRDPIEIMHKGCGRSLFEPNSEAWYRCGTPSLDVCDDCCGRYLRAIGYFDEESA